MGVFMQVPTDQNIPKRGVQNRPLAVENTKTPQSTYPLAAGHSANDLMPDTIVSRLRPDSPWQHMHCVHGLDRGLRSADGAH